LASADKQYAIIAGSGFQSFGDDAEGVTISTIYGDPSGPVRQLEYDDHTVYLLPRHGDDLSIPPHAINYRANLQALRQLNVDTVIAMNTVGVISQNIHPGQIAVPRQIIDYTWGRAHSIYDGTDGSFSRSQYLRRGRLRRLPGATPRDSRRSEPARAGRRRLHRHDSNA
jgi:purine nucleoside phosphorylase